MPATYKSPGIYIEEPPSGPRPIQGVGTSVAAFIGRTPKGDFEQPRLVTSWEQFCREFGDPQKDGSFNPYVNGSYLAYSVYGFFENGGTRCYIVRTNKTGADFGSVNYATVPSANNGGSPILELSSGELKDVKLLVGAPKPAPKLPAPAGDDKKAGAAPAEEEKIPDDVFYAELQIGATKTPLGNVSTLGNGQYKSLAEAVKTSEAKGAETLKIEFVSPDADLVPQPGSYPFLPRSEELARIQGDVTLRTGAQGLQIAEEVSIVCCPDLMAYYEGADKSTPEATENTKKMVKAMQMMLTTHCEMMSNRMVILDSLPNLDAQQAEDWSDNLGIQSPYAALYYPWIEVMKQGSNGKPETIKVPPCGHIAGVWARSDAERGVHKAPANEVIRGAIEPERKITRNEQDGLNPRGVNCIRSFAGRGTLVYGARTLAKDKAEWRYINVRRLFNYVEKSLENGMQWVVFEPNNQDLWARVTRDISAFLTQVWRDGALFGATPSQAFYVRCDESINPEDSRDAGYLYVEIGMAPVKPAEFVVFRFLQKQETAT